MASKKKPVIYTTIRVGEYKVKAKGQETTKVVLSRIDERIAKTLGVKEFPEGVPVVRTIKKGASAGAKYTVLQLGTKGKGYGLGFVDLAASSDVATKKRNTQGRIVKIPVPSGTPVTVIAEFANKLKKQPQRIVSPGGSSIYLNTSKSAGGAPGRTKK